MENIAFDVLCWSFYDAIKTKHTHGQITDNFMDRKVVEFLLADVFFHISDQVAISILLSFKIRTI